MRILVSCVPFDGGKSGISVYMREVVRALHAAGHQLTLLVEPGAAEFFPGMQTVELPKWTRRPLFSMIWHLLMLPWRIRWRDFDFCVIAAANRRTFCRYPIFTVAVVHDLAQYHVPGKYDPLRTFYLKTVLPFFVRRAQSVLAISRSTAQDLERFWRVPKEKIAIAYNGLALAQPTAESGHWRERHGLKDARYILYISRIESPGKNHLNLLKAWELLPPELTRDCRLVLAGADWHGAEEVHAWHRQSPRRDEILFTGFVASGDLPEAYEHAAGYVFPSHFEGFGLSLIEAMHYGVPCACSNNSSLGEIGMGAALLFDPADPAAIAAALRTLLTEPARCEELVAAGRKRSAEFSWEGHVARMVEAYEKWKK